MPLPQALQIQAAKRWSTQWGPSKFKGWPSNKNGKATFVTSITHSWIGIHELSGSISHCWFQKLDKFLHKCESYLNINSVLRYILWFIVSDWLLRKLLHLVTSFYSLLTINAHWLDPWLFLESHENWAQQGGQIHCFSFRLFRWTSPVMASSS